MDDESLGAIAALYSAYHDKLFVHAYAILGERELAQEAVQEAFLAACRKPEAVTGCGNPLGWLKKAVRYAALHILDDTRLSWALSRSLEELGEWEEPGREDPGDNELLARCVEAVGIEDLRLFLRIALEGYSFREEARRLGISVAACYKRFERIRDRLRAAIAEDE